MSFRPLLKILEGVELDIKIDDPQEKAVLKAYSMGPNDTTPLSEFPVVINWPEDIVDGRYTQLLNDATHTVRVQILYGLAGDADNRDVAMALFDAAFRLFDQERQAGYRLGVDEAHLLEITVEKPIIGDTKAWPSVDGNGYTSSQMLLTFSVMDRRPLNDG